MSREIPNFVSIDDLIGSDNTKSEKASKPNKTANANPIPNTNGNGSSAMVKKIKLLFALLIIYLVVNTEAFIYHVLRQFPGAVRPNETVASTTGVVVQGIIVVALYAMIDAIIANELLI